MENTDNLNVRIIKGAINYGLIVGAVGILTTVLVYALDASLLVSFKVLFLSLAISLGLTVYFGIRLRKDIGGFASYGQAFLMMFGIIATSGLVSTAFSILLFNVIDPELSNELTQATIESARGMMENFGAPEEEIDKAIEDMESKAEEGSQYSPLGLIKSYFGFLIMAAIGAAIMALFVKKNLPESI